MTPIEFEAWAVAQNLSPAGRAVVERIRTSPPSRRVNSSGGNVSGTFSSSKMGVTIQFESHTLELPLIHLLEYDDDVLEYYDQPEAIPFSYTRPDGRKIGFNSVPDFFVLKRHWAGWIEAKPSSKLEEICLKAPARISKDRDGRWTCPPAVTYAKPLGLDFVLVTDNDVNPTLAGNLELLSRYRSEKCASALILQAQCLVGDHPGIALRDLMDVLECAREDMFRLIATQCLYVDLFSHRLSHTQDAQVFVSVRQARSWTSSATPLPGINLIRVEPGNMIEWNGTKHRIVNAHNGLVSLEALDGSIQEIREDAFSGLVVKGRIKPISSEPSPAPSSQAKLLKNLSPTDLERITARQKILSGEIKAKLAPSTLYRWKAAQRESAMTHGSSALGLAGKQHLRGNRKKKLPAYLYEEMQNFIKDHFETLTAKSAHAVYLLFRNHCIEKGIKPPSDPTFRAAIKVRSGHNQKKSREGHRGAYATKEFSYDTLDLSSRHGDAPFHIGHVDHTEIDLEAVDEETGQCLGRAWLTVLIDAYSRRVLAFVLTFDPPSYRSCMLVIRHCVARHGRIPKFIVLDGGPEFKSGYFEGLLAMMECHKKVRPPAQPRFGAVLERLFGTTTTQFFHNLRGNTKLTKRSRTVTKQTDPKRLAVWTLRELFCRLEEYFFNVYDCLSHTTLLRSPREAFVAGMKEGASRGFVQRQLIPYDEGFRILTLPGAPRGSCKVHPTKGVQVGYVRYWNDLFRGAEAHGKKISVRYDPLDLSTAYAYVKTQWVLCRSWDWSITTGTSEKELRLASIAYRQRLGEHAKSRTLNMNKLGAFLKETSDHEVLLQRRRDRALAGVLEEADTMIQILPVEAPSSEASVVSSMNAPVDSSDRNSAPETPPARPFIEPYEEL
ncbi:Mu transposase, C-terminal [Verrucomicrobium sp. GAS474]|uniref:TnsA endonuclease N-terminal domain-containing protein n=1 Tax=Verrucomicrobium sp. GAS474 TaxID=1882831 RepID=UPI0008794169|nr:Mu transposase C-terminal domain-containing protein [Verrucomicrobium sp. GAS474]SDT93258.1 Mu transposase, C-terminal [Verrucomicrobium sp. GAS474]